jgi:protocatechuate 3,4-dioxygenase beta subunit
VALVALGVLALAALLWSGFPRTADAPGDGVDRDRRSTRAGVREDTTAVPASERSASSTVTGVVTRDGRPVAARVAIVRVGDVPEAGRTIPLRTIVAHARESSASASCDAEGRFALTVMRPGIYRVEARDGGGPCAFRALTIHALGQRARVDLPLPAGSLTLGGVAVFADGRPFTGRVGAFHSVQDRRFDLATAVAVETGVDGRFEIGGLHAGMVTLFASREGFVAGGRRVELPVEGEFRYVVDEGLLPVVGRVVADEDGRPVAGAEVRGEGAQRSAVARTDGDGRFRIRTGGRSTLVVSAPGFATVRGSWMAAEGAPDIEIRLVRAVRIAGQVVGSDDVPVAGVEVVARSQVRGRETASSVSDEDGRFELGGLAPGEFAVYAHGESFVSLRLAAASAAAGSGLLVSCRDGDVTGVVLTVVPAARARGRVVRPTGEGAPGIHVRIWDFDGGSLTTGWLPAVFATTDADGAFACGGLVPDVSYRAVACPGMRCEVSSGVRLARADRPVEFSLTMPPERRLAVTVVDAKTSAPLAGASVRMLARVAAGFRPFEGRWTTSGDGTAVLTDLPRGALEVRASYPGHLANGRATKVEGSDGDATQLEATVTLTRGAVVRGRVLDATGAPVPRAGIRFKAVTDVAGTAARKFIYADTEGKFRACLLPGKHRVQVSPYWPADMVVPASGDEVETGAGEIVIVLPEPLPNREKGEMVFRILDADGQPVPYGDAWIKMTRKSTSMGSEYTFAAGRLVVGIREYDRIRVEILSAFHSPGCPLDAGPAVAGPLPMRPGETVILLPRASTISGCVVRPDGEPVPGVLVQATSDDVKRAVTSTSTDARGLFVLRGIGEGEHDVSVRAPSDRAASSKVRTRPGATDLRLVLAPRTSVTIEVVDGAGRPVPGARVGARNLEDRHDGVWRDTGVDGLARLTGLDPDANLELAVSVDGRDDLAAWVESPWRPRDQRVVLSPPRALRGVVLAPDGKPVPGATVRWEGPGVHWRSSTKTDGSGRFVFGNAPPVRLRLTAVPPGAWRREWNPPAVLVEPGETDVSLLVARAGSIRVRVANAPEERIWVYLAPDRIDGKGHSWSRTLENGEATFGSLVPGRKYEILISPTKAGRTAYREAVPAGSDVKLTLVPGLTVSGRLDVPSGAEDVYVIAERAGLGVAGKVVGGRYEIRGLASGTWWIRGGAKFGWSWDWVSSPAAAGTSCDLTVPDR